MEASRRVASGDRSRHGRYGPPSSTTPRTGRHVAVDETPHRCGSGLRARLWGLIWPSPDHSHITHSRIRTVPRGHRRTRRPRYLSSGGPKRSRQDTRGHGADTVRDREARVQIRVRRGLYIQSDALQGVAAHFGPVESVHCDDSWVVVECPGLTLSYTGLEPF
jgi:hypothetical protein